MTKSFLTVRSFAPWCNRLGSSPGVSLITEMLKGAVNESFAVDPEPMKIAELMADHIERKRTEMGI